MLTPKDVYSTEIEETARAVEDKIIRGPTIPAGKVVQFSVFFVADMTTVNRIVRIGYEAYGKQHWLQRGRAGASDYGIGQIGNIILVEHERPIGMIESVPVGDTVTLFARGIYL